MIRWGKTKQGKQRFRCEKCHQTGIKKRPDQRDRRVELLFERWLLNTETFQRISKSTHVAVSTTKRKFDSIWNIKVEPCPYQGDGKILVVDGIILEKGECILIAIDGNGIPIIWHECTKENILSWIALFQKVKRQGFINPTGIVSDAQKGLIGAMKYVFPYIPHQRCMTHVVRQAQAWLTRNPKMIAGQELRLLVNSLYGVITKSDAEVFIEKFNSWCERHNGFLKEKSSSPFTKIPWYTHRRLRGVRSLLKYAIPNLFTFLEIPNTPRTTNQLEGGVNSPIKALIRHHRGMKIDHRKTLVFRFLRARQKKKYQH